MARIITVNYSPANVDLAGVAALQTTAGAGNLTLTAGAASLDLGRILAITSTGNISARTFTVTGYDVNGNAISDAITGPNNATVYGVKYFKIVSNIAVSGAVGTNTKVGWDGSNTVSAEAPIVFLDNYSIIAAEVAVAVSGTVNFSILDTNDDIYLHGTANATFFAVTALDAKTANTKAQINPLSSGLKLRINTYSNGATLKLVISQCRER